jgi:hypothetical protein
MFTVVNQYSIVKNVSKMRISSFQNFLTYAPISSCVQIRVGHEFGIHFVFLRNKQQLLFFLIPL